MARGQHYKERGGVFRTRWRKEIYEAVKREGSVTLTKLKGLLKLAQGQLQYHLDVLEYEGFLVRSPREEDGKHYRSGRPYRVSRSYLNFDPQPT